MSGSNGGAGPTDFLGLLPKPGVPLARFEAQARTLKDLAKRRGLAQLEHEGIALPLWVGSTSKWRVTGSPRGTWTAVCNEGSTGPILHFGDAVQPTSVSCDLIGISTIYWRTTDEAVVVGSRATWLVEPAERRIDLDAVFHFLNFAAVPSPFSILQGVRRLPPGYALHVREQVETKPFADLHYERLPEGTDTSPPALFRQIREAVQRTLAGLDPASTGAFLSGGTDSTTIAGLTAETFGRPLDVFSIVFEEASHSEEPFMKAAAERFAFRRHSLELDQPAFMRALEPVRQAYDEPYANASVYAAYYCYDLARDAGMHSLMAGDGGDEIFGGNERYLKDRIFSTYASIPKLVRALWELPIGRLSSGNHTVNRLRNMFRRAAMPNPDRFFADMEFASRHWSGLAGEAFRTHPVAASASLEHVRALYGQCRATEELNRLLYLDMKLAIADNDLRKVVGCGSMFGIEPKFPFLDSRLVEFVNALPASAKLRWTQKRYLFKKAVKGFLPDQILFKKKQGMGLPLGKWLRESGPVSKYASERLHDSAVAGLFDPKYVHRVWEDHQRGAWDHSEDLWRIVVLADWMATHLHQAEP